MTTGPLYSTDLADFQLGGEDSCDDFTITIDPTAPEPDPDDGILCTVCWGPKQPQGGLLVFNKCDVLVTAGVGVTVQEVADAAIGAAFDDPALQVVFRQLAMELQDEGKELGLQVVVQGPDEGLHRCWYSLAYGVDVGRCRYDRP